MGKLGLTAKLSTHPEAAPAVASRGVDSKIARQQAAPKGVAEAVQDSPRRPARAAPAQIVVRSSEKFRRAVKRWALDENTSTQELIVTALRELHRKRGLGELPE